MKKIFLSLLAIAATGSLMAGVTPHFDVEAGYDHGIARMRYDVTNSFFSNSAQMDGFHVGGNVQLDFLDGQNKPGLVVGLNYQFLAKNIADIDPAFQIKRDIYVGVQEALGASNIKTTDYAYMHTIQLPIRFKYTYQIDNDWRLFLYTGPQFRFHVAFTQDQTLTSTLNSKKNGTLVSKDAVSGKTTTTTWTNGDKNIVTIEDVTDKERFDCFDMSWGFGFGLGWDWISLAFNYDLGMINLLNNEYVKQNDWRLNSDALAVTLGFRIK